MANVWIIGFGNESEAMKRWVDKILQQAGLAAEAITTVFIGVKAETCDGKGISVPYLIVRSDSREEIQKVMAALWIVFKEAGKEIAIEGNVIDYFFPEDMERIPWREKNE